MTIAYPSGWSAEEFQSIFDAFRGRYPAEVAEWIEIEKGRLDKGEDGLLEVSALFMRFFATETDCASSMAISSVFFELRGIVHKTMN